MTKLCVLVCFVGLINILVVSTNTWAQDSFSSQTLHVYGESESDPATIFGSYQSVAMSSRGDLYIADGSFTEIRLFRNGEHVASRGREGRGPGEFTGLHSICLTADERYIVAYDYAIPRLSLFDANTLDFVRSSSPEKAAGAVYNLMCEGRGDVFLTGHMAGSTGLAHAFTLQGEYLNSSADLASDLLKEQLQPIRNQLGQAHAAPLGTDGILIALMAPYRLARVSPEGRILWSIRDPFIGDPMGKYITASGDRFSVTPYKGVTGVHVLDDKRFAVGIIDPETEESWLDVRALSGGELLNRHQLPAGTKVLDIRPKVGDVEGRIVFRQNRPYPVIEVHEW